MKGEKRIKNFMDLISNVMEAYTVILFTMDDKEKKIMKIHDFQSFSKDIDPLCRIGNGEGLVGWVLREQKKVVASNFDRNTTTLQFYKKNEDIKSLIAVPLRKESGVLYVDSKKGYRFTEEKEKIFQQIAINIEALLQIESENEEKNILKKYLSFHIEMNKLILFISSKEDFIEKFFILLFNILDIKKVFFVVPDKYVCFSEKGDYADNVIKKYDNNFYSEKSLLGWCLKYNKILSKRNIECDSDKVFIINKNEKFGENFNFIGIPLYIDNSNIYGCIGLTKNIDSKWDNQEIKILNNICLMFFREWYKRK